MIPVMPDEPTGMSYVSTEGHPEAVSLSTAIQRGLAPDGGVYMPSSWPSIRFADLADCKTLSAAAQRLLAPFLLVIRWSKNCLQSLRNHWICRCR